MKNRLTKQIVENYQRYKQRILDNIESYNYRKRRYDVDFTVALFISSDEIEADFVQKNIRNSDKLVTLDNNFIAVIFDFADEEQGLKAAENLLALMEPKFFSNEIYISVVNSHEQLDNEEHLHRAFDLLVENINSGYNDVPLLDCEE